MAAGTLLPAPAAGLALDQLQADERRIVVELATTSREAPCPLCGNAATRVQSHYWRHLADLPWQGVPVVVRLHARRFWCDHPDCPRAIFTERIPALAAPHARRTARLTAALTQIAFVLGGEGGARLLAALGMAASPDTLLGLVRQAPLAAPPGVAPLLRTMEDVVRVMEVSDAAYAPTLPAGVPRRGGAPRPGEREVDPRAGRRPRRLIRGAAPLAAAG